MRWHVQRPTVAASQVRMHEKAGHAGRDRSNAEQADYDEFRYNRLDGAFARDFAAEGR